MEKNKIQPTVFYRSGENLTLDDKHGDTVFSDVTRAGCQKKELKVTLNEDDPNWIPIKAIIKSVQELNRREESQGGGTDNKTLQEPGPGASLYDWFLHRIARRQAGYKLTLKDISNEIGIEYPAVRKDHAAWKKRMGIK